MCVLALCAGAADAQFSLKDLEKEIQNHIRGLPKRIPQSDEELDRLIEEKQFKHQTSTQSKEEERKLLKEIDKLRQTKKQLAEYNAMQDRIDVRARDARNHAVRALLTEETGAMSFFCRNSSVAGQRCRRICATRRLRAPSCSRV